MNNVGQASLFGLWLLRKVGYLLRAGLGFSGVCALGRGIGTVLWYILPSRRRYACTAIMQHLQVSAIVAREIAYQSFRHNGQSFVEVLLVQDMSPEECAQRISFVPSKDVFLQIMLCGRPIVGTSAHFGAWELLAALVPQEREAMVIVRSQRNATMNQWMKELRGSQGFAVIDHRNAADSVLQGLRRNILASFLVDHNCSQTEAIFLPFLNEVAAVNVGPAMLALRGKALVFSLFLRRAPEAGKYILEVGEEVLDTTLLEGSIKERVVAIASFYTRAVEAHVRRYPEQWFWMHKRWKTRPPE